MFVIREPAKQLSEEFKKKALEHCQVLSFASPQGGDDPDISIGTYLAAEMDLAHALSEIDTKLKDFQVIYHFFDTDEEVGEACLQPFVLQDNNEKDDDRRIYQVAFTDGSFPDFADEDKELTNSFRFVNNFLSPLVEEELEKAKQDLPDLIASLKSESIRTQITEKLGKDNAVIMVHCFPGEAISYGSTGEATPHAWGFASKSLGFEKPITPDTAAKAKRILLNLRPTKGETSPVPDKEKKEKLPPGGTEAPEVKWASALKDWKFKLEGGELWCRPDKGTLHREARAWWNRNTVLEIPKDDKGELIYRGFPIAKCKAGAPILDALAKLTGNKVPKVADSDQGPAKPGEQKKEQQQPPVEMTYLIPADQKKSFTEQLAKGVYKPAAEEKLKAALSSYPLATVALGMTPEFLRNLSIEGFSRLPTHIKTMFFHEVRCRWLGWKVDEKPKEAAEEPEVMKTRIGHQQPKIKLNLNKKVA